MTVYQPGDEVETMAGDKARIVKTGFELESYHIEYLEGENKGKKQYVYVEQIRGWKLRMKNRKEDT